MTTTLARAAARVAYDPAMNGVPVAPYWVIVTMRSDLTSYYRRWIERSMGRWVQVLDDLREIDIRLADPVTGRHWDTSPIPGDPKGSWRHPFTGRPTRQLRFTDPRPRLAYRHPTLAEPVWGPHASIIRGEEPTQNYTPGRWKHPKGLDYQREFDRLLRAATTGRGSMHPQRVKAAKNRVGVRLQKMGFEWVPGTWTPPSWAQEGVPIEIWYDPDVKTNGNHWWLDLPHKENSRLLDLREHFGLPRNPPYALHLSLGNFQDRSIGNVADAADAKKDRPKAAPRPSKKGPERRRRRSRRRLAYDAKS